MDSNLLTIQEFINKYASVSLRFKSYYKYTFYFNGIAEDGAKITASYGGNAEDIYRYEVVKDSAVEIMSIDNFNSIVVTKNDIKIFEHYGCC